MIKDGTWKHQKQTNEEVVELFFAKSTYYKYYQATFANVYHFPEIVFWLCCKANAQGSQHPSIGVLIEVMKKRKKEAVEEGISGSSKKNKGKAKESGKKDKGKERKKSHKKQHKYLFNAIMKIWAVWFFIISLLPQVVAFVTIEYFL
ncbi:hypothetical protein C0995_001942 [Termitomyces sp. Mi166|nr:hypothetical protein C0995_001942 [Termitomyces sp. Mi166\